MSDQSLKEYACVTCPLKKYSSKYTWKIADWSFIKTAISKNGATSRPFYLNGLPGYSCKLSLLPSTFDLVMEFSDTQEIKVMEVTCDISLFSIKSAYAKPVPQRQVYPTAGKFIMDRQDKFSQSEENSLDIVATITIARESDASGHLNPPKVSPLMFSIADSLPPNIPADEMKNMIDQEVLGDVRLVLGDKTFYAHKEVLAARSTVFKAMFSSDIEEEVVEISNTSVNVFEEFLNYLYRGEVTKWEKMAEEMIVIADFYKVPDLKIVCENIMVNSISENSVERFQDIGIKANSETLRKKVSAVIQQKHADQFARFRYGDYEDYESWMD